MCVCLCVSFVRSAACGRERTPTPSARVGERLAGAFFFSTQQHIATRRTHCSAQRKRFCMGVEKNANDHVSTGLLRFRCAEQVLAIGPRVGGCTPLRALSCRRCRAPGNDVGGQIAQCETCSNKQRGCRSIRAVLSFVLRSMLLKRKKKLHTHTQPTTVTGYTMLPVLLPFASRHSSTGYETPLARPTQDM